MKKENWVWMPHAGHFCASRWCQFKLNTYVGGYIVSTVGEYLPDAGIREIFAENRKVTLEGKGDARLADYMRKIGYEDIAINCKYETMVFKAERAETKGEECCPWRMQSGQDVDSTCYKTPEEAFKGHMKLCAKWSKKS